MVITRDIVGKIREGDPVIKEWWEKGGGSPYTSCHLCFISKDMLQVNMWMSCKDYMHEILDGQVKGTSYRGYDRPSYAKIDFSALRIAVTVGKDKDEGISHIYNIISFIHDIEKAQKVTLSKLYFGGLTNSSVYNASQEVWVLEADKSWMHASPLLSFYLMSIRLGIDYNGMGWRKFMESGTNSKVSERDRGYVNSSNHFWKKLIGSSPTELFGKYMEYNYPKGKNIGHVTGYLWMSMYNYTKQFPHWKNLHKDIKGDPPEPW